MQMQRFYVVRDGRDSLVLFLIDRRIRQDVWWTTDTAHAMVFESADEAESAAKKLRYGRPSVVDEHTARAIEAENTHEITLRSV